MDYLYDREHQRYIGVPLFLVLALLSECCNSIKWQLEPQPDDVDRGSYDEPRPDDGHICLRECERGEIARICYYKFHLEEHSVLGSDCGDCPETQSDCLNPGCVTADAYEQTVLTVNRRLPGPSIQVCIGDTVLVDVVNNIADSSVTLHWHGVKHLGAPGTPWMDGVPYITQCPVLYNQTFQYQFLPGESGSFLWHAYDGAKQLQGLVGSLIVREPYSSDSLSHLYDYDLPSHIMLIQDWVHRMVDDNSIESVLRYLSWQTGDSGSKSQVPDAYLINGRGIELTLHRPKQMPVTEFYVHYGFRYRFRVIGGTSLTCPFRLTVQGHQLLVISADTNIVKPVLVDSLIVSSGERYDVVLNATQPVCSYWVLVEGVGDCWLASQVALLRYHGCTPDNLTLPLNLAPGIPKAVDRYFFYDVAVTSEMPNSTTKIHVPLNAVFEILMINSRTTNMSLSCHIHGHDFYIVEQERLPDPSLSESLHDLQLRLADKRFVSRFMPSKDTIAVSGGGYALVRILADNPGFWLLRCRSDPELSAVLQVGRLSDIPPLPSDFPACEGFKPYSTDFLTM